MNYIKRHLLAVPMHMWILTAGMVLCLLMGRHTEAAMIGGLFGVTLADGYPTLLDVSKQFSTDGQPLPLAELLQQTNPMLDDIPWIEANGTNGHRISARAGYPDAVYRKLNAGVSPSKSSYQDITESMGLMASLGVVDKKLVELSGNPAKFRMNESKGHIEAMGNTFASTLFYGDTDISPEQFLGLSPRFDDLSGPNNAAQIIDAGGNDTDLASIWVVGWGETSVYGIYPKGTQAGLIHKDMGEELVNEVVGGVSSGRMYPALRDWFEWNGGIAVNDWRNIVRIANIDISNLTVDGATGAKLIDLLVFAVEQMNKPEVVRPVIYAPRRVLAFLRQQITHRSNVWLSTGEVAGKKATMFDGIPVRRSDALLLTESRIV